MAFRHKIRSKVKPRWPTLNRSHPLARGLVALWPFPAATGDETVELVASYQTDDDFLGGTHTWGVGKHGWQLEVDDTQSAGLTAQGLPATSPDEVTVAILAQANKNTTNTNPERAIHWGENWQIIWDWSNTTYATSFTVYDNGTYPTADFGDFVAGEWYFLVGTYEKSTREYKAYTNGVLKDTQTGSTDVYDQNSSEVGIGMISGGGGIDPMDGKIAFVALWDRPLNATEVLDLYLNPWALITPTRHVPAAAAAAVTGSGMAFKIRSKVKPRWPVLDRNHPLARGLKCAFHISERGGDEFFDIASNGRLPITSHSVSLRTLTDLGPTYDFNATAYASGSCACSNDDSVTVAVWARWTATNSDVRSFAAQWGGTSRWWLGINYDSGTSQVRWQARDSGTTVVDTATDYNDGEWHLIVAISPVGGQAAVYIDGLGEKVVDGGAPMQALASGPHDLDIGAYAGGSGPIDAEIADVRVWSRALSDAEILDLWENPWDLYVPRRQLSVRAPTAGAVSGSGTGTLGGLAASGGTGYLAPEGSGTASLGGLASSGTGTFGPTGATGDAGIFVGGLAASGSAGTYGPTGSGTGSLSGLAGSGTGTVGEEVTGSGTAALSGLAAASSTGWVEVQGSGTGTLGGLAGSGTGTQAGVVSGYGVNGRIGLLSASGTGWAGSSGTGTTSLSGLSGTGSGYLDHSQLPAALSGLRAYGYGTGAPTSGSGTEALSGLAASGATGTSTYTVSGSGTAALSGLASSGAGMAFVPVTGSGVASLSGLKVPDKVVPSLAGLTCTGDGTFTNATAPTGSGTAALGGLATGDPRLQDPAETSDDDAVAPSTEEGPGGVTEYRFHIGFPYLHEDHVVTLISGDPVTVGVTVDTSASDENPHGEVVLTEESGYSPGVEVVIMRVTPSEDLWNVFVSGADVEAADANAAMKHLLYLAEELELLLKPSGNPTVRIPVHIRLPPFVQIIINPQWYKPTIQVTTTTTVQIMLNLTLGVLPSAKFVFPSDIQVTSATLLALRNLEGKILWEGQDILAGLKTMDPPERYRSRTNYKFAKGSYTVGVKASESQWLTIDTKTGRTLTAILRTQGDASSVFLDWEFIHYWGDTKNGDIHYSKIPSNVIVQTASGPVTLIDWNCDRLGLNNHAGHGCAMLQRARMQFDAAGNFTVVDVTNPVTTGLLPPYFRAITPSTTSSSKTETLTAWMAAMMGGAEGRDQFHDNDWAKGDTGQSGDSKNFGYRHFDVDIWADANTDAREAQVFDILSHLANRPGHFIEPYSGNIWEVGIKKLVVSAAGGFRPASSDYKDIAPPAAGKNWAPTGENWFNHPSRQQQTMSLRGQYYDQHQGTNNQHWSLGMLCMAVYRWNDVGLWWLCMHAVEQLKMAAPTTKKGGTYHNINAARGRGRVLYTAAVLFHVTGDSTLEEYAAATFDNMYLTEPSNPVGNKENYQDNGVPTRWNGAAAFEVSFWVMGLRAVLATWPGIRNAANIATLESELCLWIIKAWRTGVPGHTGTYGMPYGLTKDASAAWPGQNSHARGTAKQCVAPVQVALRHYRSDIEADPDSGITVAKAEAIVQEWKTDKIRTTAEWRDEWRWLYE